MKAEEKVLCPKCGEEAKQFEIPMEYRLHYGARGRYYCDRCGWMEDHEDPIPSLIAKKAKGRAQSSAK
jgi:rubredoxin